MGFSDRFLEKMRGPRAVYREELRVAVLDLDQLVACDEHTFWEILNMLANELELSDDDIAGLTRTSRETVNRWRNKKVTPREHSRTMVLRRLADHL